MKCLVLIELDLNIALPSRAAGSATLHFSKVNFTIFQSLIGFYSLFYCCFLLQVRGYLINHHFKVARVICIQIRGAAPVPMLGLNF